MSNPTKVTLKIILYENPSGHLSHRVTGAIHGERVQKNFPTNAEVRTFMNGLVPAAGQGKSTPQRVTTTNLPRVADLREAQMPWQRFAGPGPRGNLCSSG